MKNVQRIYVKRCKKKVGERKIVRIVRRTELCRPAQLTSSWRRHDGAASSWRGAFHDRHGRHCRPVRAAWPVKSRQMSIKSGPKLISQEKWKIWTPLTNCLKCVHLGKIIVATGLGKLPKVQSNAQSGHTAYGQLFFRKKPRSGAR